MMVQDVEHVWCFAHRRRNDPLVERPVMARDRCVGSMPYFALTEPPPAGNTFVRERGRPVVPDRGHRVPVVCVYDRGDVGVVVDMPPPWRHDAAPPENAVRREAAPGQT